MFLHRGTTGGDGLDNPSQSTMISTSIQQISPTLSHTGNYERRAEIRKLGANALVDTHNALVNKIIASGAISKAEKNIILSMEQEGVNVGGEFFGKIQENNTAHTIPHKEGMSKHNEIQGTTEVLRGSTRLRMWELVTS